MCEGPEEVSSMVVSPLSLEIFIPLCIRQVFWAPVHGPEFAAGGPVGNKTDSACLQGGFRPEGAGKVSVHCQTGFLGCNGRSLGATEHMGPSPGGGMGLREQCHLNSIQSNSC